MDDTSPEIKKVQEELFQKMSGYERLVIASEMFETARKIVLSSFPEGMPEVEKRVNLFLRFYGNDFPPAEKEKIIEAIRAKFNSTK